MMKPTREPSGRFFDRLPPNDGFPLFQEVAAMASKWVRFNGKLLNIKNKMASVFTFFS